MKKILLSVLLSAPLWVLGQGFQVNLQGQKQIGMAGGGGGFGFVDGFFFFFFWAGCVLLEKSISTGVKPHFI